MSQFLNDIYKYGRSSLWRTSLCGTLCMATSLVLAICCCQTVMAQPTGPTQPVILDHADSLNGTQTINKQGNTESVLRLRGNVRLRQGNISINADEGILYEASNRAVLIGNVRIVQPGMVMTAPRVEYDGPTKIAKAPAGTVIEEGGGILQAGYAEYYIGERKSVFRNGLTMHDSAATIQADGGEYYSVDRKAEFHGNVLVKNDSTTVSSRTLTYWRDTREAYATGNVVLVSERDGAQLTGDIMQNIPAIDYTVVTGSPRLLQVDTTIITTDTSKTIQLDTTVITAKRMEAFRGERSEYIATDSVKIVRGSLQAISAVARFLNSEEVIALGPKRQPVLPDTSHAPPDSNITPAESLPERVGNEPVTGVSPEPQLTPAKSLQLPPVVWYDNSQLTGDSISIRLKEKKVQAIDVLDNAFAVSQGEAPNRFDQLAGNRLLFLITQDTVRAIRAEGLASSIYFLYEENRPNGLNRASGDTIVIRFAGGKPSTIGIYKQRTRLEGDLIPEQEIRGNESSFRLSGFQWFGRDGILETYGSGMANVTVPDETATDTQKETEPETIPATKRR